MSTITEDGVEHLVFNEPLSDAIIVEMAKPGCWGVLEEKIKLVKTVLANCDVIGKKFSVMARSVALDRCSQRCLQLLLPRSHTMCHLLLRASNLMTNPKPFVSPTPAQPCIDMTNDLPPIEPTFYYETSGGEFFAVDNSAVQVVSPVDSLFERVKDRFMRSYIKTKCSKAKHRIHQLGGADPHLTVDTGKAVLETALCNRESLDSVGAIDMCWEPDKS